MSDLTIVALASGILSLIGTVFTGIMAYFISRLNNKTNEIKEVSDATHTLVNSNMSAQLQISALALRRISVLTNDPEDIVASVQADMLLKDRGGVAL